MEPIVMYLCDGEKECGKTDGCYLNGGKCRHTIEEKHAKIKGVTERHENVVPGANGRVYLIEVEE